MGWSVCLLSVWHDAFISISFSFAGQRFVHKHRISWVLSSVVSILVWHWTNSRFGDRISLLNIWILIAWNSSNSSKIGSNLIRFTGVFSSPDTIQFLFFWVPVGWRHNLTCTRVCVCVFKFDFNILWCNFTVIWFLYMNEEPATIIVYAQKFMGIFFFSQHVL